LIRLPLCLGTSDGATTAQSNPLAIWNFYGHPYRWICYCLSRPASLVLALCWGCQYSQHNPRLLRMAGLLVWGYRDGQRKSLPGENLPGNTRRSPGGLYAGS
jgi:hypothetical protein